ncbi:MAG: type II toxin-antitoxin system HipA family toxin [Bryobacteraceae bacterium]
MKRSGPTPWQALAVQLHGQRIGVINRLAGERHLFSFEQAYLDDPARSTLSLSYKNQQGDLVSSVKPVRRRVPPFFSNLLPEGHLRTYLSEQAGVNPEREYLLLGALGADLPGAVVITPYGEPDLGDDLSATLRSATREASVLRFSLAGIQLKFSAVMEAAGGLTIPAEGIGGSWIVKLPSLSFAAVPENEYLMLRLARAAGIHVPEARLVPVGEIRGLPLEASRLPGMALALRRFDRTNSGQRIHMEDFAQVFGLFPEAKYKLVSYSMLARVLAAETGPASIEQFIRRLTFSVVTGNGDMHLKNWSLLYPDERSAVLSPAYDLVATAPYIPGDQLALTFGGSRSMLDIDEERIRRFAEKAALAVDWVSGIVAETIGRTVDEWQRLDEKALLPPEVLGAIDAQISRFKA